MYSLDVIQAYLQSTSQLRRKILIKPDIINLDANEPLRLIILFYGLSDYGDYWPETFRDHGKSA